MPANIIPPNKNGTSFFNFSVTETFSPAAILGNANLLIKTPTVLNGLVKTKLKLYNAIVDNDNTVPTKTRSMLLQIPPNIPKRDIFLLSFKKLLSILEFSHRFRVYLRKNKLANEIAKNLDNKIRETFFRKNIPNITADVVNNVEDTESKENSLNAFLPCKKERYPFVEKAKGNRIAENSNPHPTIFLSENIIK